jgi:4-hydroxy-2-oxoheptanedioate aldolase
MNAITSRGPNRRTLSACTILSVLLTTISCFAQSAPAVGNVPRLNRVVELMEKGEPALGIFSFDLSPRTGAWIASSKLDFVVVDLEHSPYDMSRLEAYMLATVDKRQILQKGSLQPNVVPIVRIPTPGREHLLSVIKQVLDLGPMGILVPQVENAEDARAAVRACRYPQPKGSAHFEPAGLRGVGYSWAARQWGLPGSEYVQKADLWPLNPKGELLLWLMIETRQAVENIREIVTVPGISGLFIGPSDLSFALGVPPGSPEVEDAMAKVLAVCREAKIPCGTFDSQVKKRLQQGFQFVAVGADAGISAGVQESLKQGEGFRKR